MCFHLILHYMYFQDFHACSNILANSLILIKHVERFTILLMSFFISITVNLNFLFLFHRNQIVLTSMYMYNVCVTLEFMNYILIKRYMYIETVVCVWPW